MDFPTQTATTWLELLDSIGPGETKLFPKENTNTLRYHISFTPKLKGRLYKTWLDKATDKLNVHRVR